VLNGLLIVTAGFVIAGTLLFVLSARGFESRAYVRNAVVGMAIAGFTYAFFTYGLGLALPAGILPF
ncbi:MAG: tripartite tricarboxylate transporter TctB family protein, partial [Burkholderiales bacterium]